MMKLDDLIAAEYSPKAADQSKARGSQPTPKPQPKQRIKPQRIMRADPDSLKKIESRQELFERLSNAGLSVRITSINGGKSKRGKQ